MAFLGRSRLLPVLLLALLASQWSPVEIAFVGLQPRVTGAPTAPATTGSIMAGGAVAARGQRGGRVAAGVLKKPLQWIRNKLAGLKKTRPSTYDTMILQPMLARIEQASTQSGSGSILSEPGTYESVILEPMLKRIAAAK